MHAAVDGAAREIDLELLGEQSLAADCVQRFVQLFVAERLVRLELRDDAAARQGRLDESRLSQRELRRSRCDEKTPLHRRFVRLAAATIDTPGGVRCTC